MKGPFSDVLASRGPTAKIIQSLLQRIGAPITGTKDVLQGRLLREVERDSQTFGHAGSKKRILSIDMGIKNLAFCVADATRPKPSDPIRMQVTQWSRLDLTDPTLSDQIKATLGPGALSDSEADGFDMFAPQSLASTAYWLVQHRFLQYQPDIVLIERQRWRSASASSIAQWTIRVNSLEAMLWAVLTTLRTEYQNLPEGQSKGVKKTFILYSADPKRVGQFWLNAEPGVVTKRGGTVDALDQEEVDDDQEESQLVVSTATPKKLGRTKMEKKAKIQLLRTWLNHDEPSTALSAPGKVDKGALLYQPVIMFDFPAINNDMLSNARETRQQFLRATESPAENRQRRLLKSESKTKVDDLADCFLQATAYVAWMENRAALKNHLYGCSYLGGGGNAKATADRKKPKSKGPTRGKAPTRRKALENNLPTANNSTTKGPAT